MSVFDLQEFCTREHLSLADLSRAFDVHQTTISRMKRRGGRNPMDTFMHLAALAQKAPVELWPCLAEIPSLANRPPPHEEDAQ